jgi:hypothetical protein
MDHQYTDNMSYTSLENILHTLPTIPIFSGKNIFTKPSSHSESLYEAQQLLPILSDIRSSEYKSWFDIGSVLYIISNGSRNGLETWIIFSKRTNTFTKEDCSKEWITMKPSTHNIRILFYYCKMDNIDAYTSYKNTICNHKFQQIIKLHGFELFEASWAEMMYILYKDEFFYHDNWYIGDVYEWSITKECIELQQQIPKLIPFITDEINKRNSEISTIINERMDIEERSKSTENDTLIKELNDKIQNIDGKVKQLIESRKQLYKNSFKTNIIKECKLLFFDKTIMKRTKIISIENKKEESSIEEDKIQKESIKAYNIYTNEPQQIKITNQIETVIIEKLKDVEWKASDTYKRLNVIINDFQFKKSNIISQKVKEYLIKIGIKVVEDKNNGHKIYVEY